MDLREQEYFIAIAEEGSISRAAAKLHISQSALSQHLTKLEQEAGAVLIRRARFKDPELTEAGRRYYECCRSMMYEWNKTTQDIQTIGSGGEGLIRIGLSNTAGGIPLFQKLNEISEKYPGLQIEFEDGRGTLWPEKILRGDYHLVIAAWIEETPGIIYIPRAEFRLELGVPRTHPLAKYSYKNPGQENTEISLTDLKNEPLLLMGPETIMGHALRQWFIREHFFPRVVATFSNINVMQCAMEECGMIGLYSKDMRLRPLSKDILPVRIKDAVRYKKGIMYRKDLRLSAPLKEILEDLKKNGI